MRYNGLSYYNSVVATSFAACLQACDNDDNCYGGEFQVSTDTCRFFYNLPSQLTASLVADEDFVVGTFDPAVTCTGTG